MVWNKMPYWLRGGIIGIFCLGVFVAFELLLLSSGTTGLDFSSTSAQKCHYFYIWIQSPITQLLKCSFGENISNFSDKGIIEFLTFLLSWFIYGAIIGGIFNKLKNK